MPDDISKQDMYAYSVFWKGVTIGFCKDVDPSGIVPVVKEKKMTPFGDVVLDRIWRGVTGEIKTIIHQTDLVTVKAMCPWWTTGPVSGSPASTNYAEYANAGALLLHPYGLLSTDTSCDMTFLKAFPRIKPPKASGDWRELEVTWSIYPDQAQIVNGISATYYYGPPPAP